MVTSAENAIIVMIFNPKFKLEVSLVTPGGVPGVFDEKVLQATGLINAISDSEYAVVYGVKVFIVIQDGFCAIACIDDATRVLMDVLVVGSDTEDNWLCLKNGFYIIYIP